MLSYRELHNPHTSAGKMLVLGSQQTSQLWPQPCGEL